MNVETVLLTLLREELCGETVSDEVKEAISPEMLEPLYELSRKQTLAHIAGQALSKLGKLGQDEVSRKFQEKSMGAVTNHIRMNHAFHSICKALEEAKLPYMPLKGSVLKQWYPETWMRISADIDILVHAEDHQAAVKCLVDKCDCRYLIQSNHDVSLCFPGKIHIEVHHMLIEDTVSTAQEKVLSQVWDTACQAEGSQYRYQMSDAMFRFYHYAHMSKHIKNGGCGIRPFMDLWVMNHLVKQDRTGEENLIALGDLTAFYQILRWFRILFKGGIEQSAKELATNANTTKEESAFITQLIQELKL